MDRVRQLVTDVHSQATMLCMATSCQLYADMPLWSHSIQLQAVGSMSNRTADWKSVFTNAGLSTNQYPPKQTEFPIL